MYKLTTLILLYVVFLASCKKNDSSPPEDHSTASAKFTLQYNGKSYEFDGDKTITNSKGSWISKIHVWTPVNLDEDVYFLTGSNGLGASDPDYINISIPVAPFEDLYTGSYFTNLYAAIGVLGGIEYGNNEKGWGGNYAFNFSFVSNSLNIGNGSFSATLYPVDTSLHLPPLAIYGTFKNTKIHRY